MTFTFITLKDLNRNNKELFASIEHTPFLITENILNNIKRIKVRIEEGWIEKQTLQSFFLFVKTVVLFSFYLGIELYIGKRSLLEQCQKLIKMNRILHKL